MKKIVMEYIYNKINILILIGMPAVVSLFMACSSSSTKPVLITQKQNYQLVYSSDINYLGSFKLPQSSDLALTFGGETDTAGKGFAYYSSGNNGQGSLYVVGHPYSEGVGEMSIPALYTGSSINSVPQASILQSMTDITQGNRSNVDCNGHGAYAGGGSMQIGALAVYNNKLIGGEFATYNANNEVCYSYFSHSLTTSTPSFAGMYQMGGGASSVPSPGYFGGYMGSVPPSYQSLLGGPLITGNGMTSIISQTSNGPSLFSFDPANFTGTNTTPVPITSLLYYQSGVHETLGAWGTSTQYTSINDKIMGVVFPVGSSSVLFFGRHGTGASCYGPGTSTLSEATTTPPAAGYSCSGVSMPGNDGDNCCYDTCDHSKGTHSYPYNYQVWAYDVNDLIAVKNGTKQPYEPVPYAMWTLPMRFNSMGTDGFHVGISGVAYDSVNQRIFVIQQDTDIVQVFKVSISN